MTDKKQRTRAPSGIAGLVRYEEEEESAIKLSPEIVVLIATGLIILEILFLFLLPL